MDLQGLDGYAFILEEQAATYASSSTDDLIAQGDADTRRLSKEQKLLQTPEVIRDRLRATLVLSLLLMGERRQEAQWRAGLVGAILQGRISILREILDWIEMVQCSVCGGEIGEGAKFCGQCGAAAPSA